MLLRRCRVSHTRLAPGRRSWSPNFETMARDPRTRCGLETRSQGHTARSVTPGRQGDRPSRIQGRAERAAIRRRRTADEVHVGIG